MGDVVVERCPQSRMACDFTAHLRELLEASRHTDGALIDSAVQFERHYWIPKVNGKSVRLETI